VIQKKYGCGEGLVLGNQAVTVANLHVYNNGGSEWNKNIPIVKPDKLGRVPLWKGKLLPHLLYF